LPGPDFYRNQYDNCALQRRYERVFGEEVRVPRANPRATSHSNCKRA